MVNIEIVKSAITNNLIDPSSRLEAGYGPPCLLDDGGR